MGRSISLTVLFIAVLLTAQRASGQVHPCDQAVVSPGPTLVAGAHTVTVCWTGKGGTWSLLDNGVKTALGAPSVSATASSGGLSAYSWPVTLSSTPTAHTYTVEVCTPDGIGGVACVSSAPFVQPSVKLPLPSTPMGLRVQ